MYILTIALYHRASGTEDAVRIYAEAATRADTEALAKKITSIVYENGGGVGKHPFMP